MWKRVTAVGVLVLALGLPTTSAAQHRGRHGHEGQRVAREHRDDDQGRRGRDRGRRADRDRDRDDDRNRGRDDDEQLRRRLPPGITLEQAQAGFKNRGQFVAALNASHNHNVSFFQLKDLMVNRGMSLGQAMKTLRRR